MPEMMYMMMFVVAMGFARRERNLVQLYHCHFHMQTVRNGAGY